MRRNTEKKKRPFVYWMGLYAVIFLGLTAAGLLFLGRFLSAYEASRPDNAAAAYMEHFGTAEVLQLSAQLLDQLDINVQPRSRAEGVIAAYVADGVSYAKQPGAGAEEAVYALIAQGRKIGQVRFVPGETLEFGFRAWRFDSAEADLSFLKGTAGFTIPSDWSATSFGLPVRSEYRTGREEHFDYVSDVPASENYVPPTLQEYALGNFLGEAELRFYDAAGVEQELPAEGFGEDYIDIQDPALYAEVRDFALEFTDRYYLFSSALRGQVESRFNQLYPLLLDGGRLHQRLSASIENLAWSQNRGSELTGKNVVHCVDLGNGDYLCGVTYQVLVNSKDGLTVTETDNRCKLILRRTAAGLRVVDLYSY